MKELSSITTCYSRFIVDKLDDTTAHDCGKCSNCLHKELIPTDLSLDDKLKALAYLNGIIIKIEPRKKWSDSSITGQGYIETPNEVGICLSKYNDVGYGKLVRQGKYDTGEFDERLIERSVELLSPIVLENNIMHICCVPSLRSDSVKTFTVKLAARLGIEFIDCLKKSKAEPQKMMQNSAFQCRNAWDSFSVSNSELPSKLILVDDIVDSKWTMTVCGYKLMQNGAEFVFPYALADSSRR